VLLLIVFGALDFSRALNYWNDANQIAADGARFAAVNRNPGSGTLQEWLAQQGDTAEIRNGSASVTTPIGVCVEFPDGEPAQVGDPVRVRVTVGYSVIPLIDPDATEVQLVGDATMRLEQKPTNYAAGGSCAA